MEIRIIRFDRAHLSMLPHHEEPFDVIGRLIPEYDGESWSVREKLFAQPKTKTYPPEEFDPMQYIDSENDAAYLALAGERCIGSVRVCRRWNGMGFIDDLKIDRACRGCGVGKQLLDAAVGWCREMGLSGLSLETQDNNLLACRFYLKYGFELGGIDGKCYTHEAYKGETALYFYLRDAIYNAE